MSERPETDAKIGSSNQLLTPLFASDEAARLFDDRARLQGMLDFEAALARAEAGMGVIPQAAVSPSRAGSWR
jgi:3-carboxy-cis,cis-muconate cycloisomerase